MVLNKFSRFMKVKAVRYIYLLILCTAKAIYLSVPTRTQKKLNIKTTKLLLCLPCNVTRSWHVTDCECYSVVYFLISGRNQLGQKKSLNGIIYLRSSFERWPLKQMATKFQETLVHSETSLLFCMEHQVSGVSTAIMFEMYFQSHCH